MWWGLIQREHCTNTDITCWNIFKKSCPSRILWSPRTDSTLSFEDLATLDDSLMSYPSHYLSLSIAIMITPHHPRPAYSPPRASFFSPRHPSGSPRWKKSIIPTVGRVVMFAALKHFWPSLTLRFVFSVKTLSA